MTSFESRFGHLRESGCQYKIGCTPKLVLEVLESKIQKRGYYRCHRVTEEGRVPGLSMEDAGGSDTAQKRIPTWESQQDRN